MGSVTAETWSFGAWGELPSRKDKRPWGCHCHPRPPPAWLTAATPSELALPFTQAVKPFHKVYLFVCLLFFSAVFSSWVASPKPGLCPAGKTSGLSLTCQFVVLEREDDCLFSHLKGHFSYHLFTTCWTLCQVLLHTLSHLILTKCVALDQSLDLCKPQFPHL